MEMEGESRAYYTEGNSASKCYAILAPPGHSSEIVYYENDPSDSIGYTYSFRKIAPKPVDNNFPNHSSHYMSEYSPYHASQFVCFPYMDYTARYDSSLEFSRVFRPIPSTEHFQSYVQDSFPAPGLIYDSRLAPVRTQEVTRVKNNSKPKEKQPKQPKQRGRPKKNKPKVKKKRYRPNAAKNERERLKVFNKAYDKLRSVLPETKAGNTLTKKETLRHAIRYIKYLEEILENGEEEIIDIT